MKKKGFTLAEILITLTIVGVLAALTIPSLMANTDEKVLEAKRKALHARLAQAVAQLNIKDYLLLNDDGTDKGSALNFVTAGLNKVYKLSAVCDVTNMKACNFPTEVVRMDGGTATLEGMTKFEDYFFAMKDSTIGNIDVKPVLFRTQNGESVLMFYNPKCKDVTYNQDGNTFGIQVSICLNFIYDLNGATEGQNKVGSDVGFITVMNPTSPSVVAPVPDTSNITGVTIAMTDVLPHTSFLESLFIAPAYADGTDPTPRTAAEACFERGYIMPSLDEALSMVANDKLIRLFVTPGQDSGAIYTGSTDNMVSEGKYPIIQFGTGFFDAKHWEATSLSSANSMVVRCIKK